ncbi:MAG TPA: CAP domain-containing protein, partial [Polyangiaceae bacterium]
MELHLLDALNAARRAAALPNVVGNPDLRAVARAHSLDMQQHGYFGHVSPSTGTVQERSQRAKIRFSKVGECLAMNSSPEDAMVGLLASPAHRATMLDPDFDSVGVGVTVNHDEANQTTLLLTMVFARLPPPEAAKLSETDVLATFQELRHAKNLSPLRVDAGLVAAARVGGRSAAEVPDSTVGERLSRGTTATNRVLQKPVNRRLYSRTFC